MKCRSKQRNQSKKKMFKQFLHGSQKCQDVCQRLAKSPVNEWNTWWNSNERYSLFYYYFIIKRTINPIKMRNAQQSDETHSIKGHVEKKAIEIIIK